MVEKGNPQFDDILAEESKTGGGIAALPERLSRYGKGHRRALLMANYATQPIAVNQNEKKQEFFCFLAGWL